MFPVLTGKVIVSRQPIPVLHHRLDRLGVVPKGSLELLSLLERFFPALGVHHRGKIPLDFDLLLHADRIDDLSIL